MAGSSQLPLCVDCDGTLIRTDLLHESVLLLVKRSWSSVFSLPFWLMHGKAYLKQRIAERVTVDARTLPYNQEVVDLVRRARAEGRTTVLATASPRSQAEAIQAHLSLFDRVEATDDVNLSSHHKSDRLVELFGKGGFVYAGNGRADVEVWRASAGAIVVSPSASLREAAASMVPVEQTIATARPTPKTWLTAIRVHQWLKNILVFVPLLAAHRIHEPQAMLNAALAFLAFGLCASAVYVINDLLDLPCDRMHVRKRNRPFASGAIPVVHGMAAAPALLLGSALVCSFLPGVFALTLLCYFAVTCIYSFWLKNQVVVDVMLLAGLYTSRILAGAAATAIVPSFWLLAFSVFLFLSLAIVKRYSEMLVVLQRDLTGAAGRGYIVTDMPVLMSLGTAAGYGAVLVLMLYVNGDDMSGLYPNRWALWLVPPPLLYWMTRIWMKVQRGEMHDDPVVFAVTDRQSWVVAAVIGAALAIASWTP